MADAGKITLYHSPNTRSSGTLLLLEELGVPYELKVINMKAGEQRQPAYLAVNPMGKVPAIRHGDAIITEQVAIHIYLADQFPEKGLAPPIGSPLRGPYLRWIAFYAAAFEPAVVNKALKRESGPLAMEPFGDFDTMLKTLVGQISGRRFIVGDRLTAADVLWGTGLTWTTMFKIVPELPEIMAYIKPLNERPAVARVRQIDTELAAQHEQA